MKYLFKSFGGRAEFHMDAGHIFPQGVLAPLTLVGGEARDGVARSRTGCEAGLPLCRSHPLLGAGSYPKLLEQKP